jgi:hypothetical protein
MQELSPKIDKQRYLYLKSLKTLNSEEQKQIEIYEKSTLIDFYPNLKEITFLMDNSKEKENSKASLIRYLHKSFFIVFNKIYQKKFSPLKEFSEMLSTLLFYFSKDERFYQSKCLLKNFNKPSLTKGLLIIGDYGVGKSVMMRTFALLFLDSICPRELAFRAYNMNELIDAYEKDYDKYVFWQNLKGGRIYFDDVKNERLASYYGKINLMEKILQDRYNNPKATTFITSNYDVNYPNDLEKAIEQFKPLSMGLWFMTDFLNSLISLNLKAVVFDGSSKTSFLVSLSIFLFFLYSNSLLKI